MNNKKKTLKIGNLVLENPFLMAPLAGITDAPYRRLCSRYGASLVYTEMISCKGLYYGDKKTDKMLFMYEDEAPIGIQVFGENTKIMSEAIKILEPRKNKLIDVNFGCPVPKVVKNGEGSALLKDPDKIYDIIYSLVKSTSKPVTGKIRIGFKDDDFLGLEAAKAIEAGGGSAVTVHGRTREQFYNGKANWEEIRKIKENLGIPVIANGDVMTAEDGLEIMEVTGCDLVMVARGALGNPWLFKGLNQAYNKEEINYRPSIEEIKGVFIEHLEMMKAIKGEYTAVREMRKFAGWYLKGIKGSSAFRGKINNIIDIEELKQAVMKIGN